MTSEDAMIIELLDEIGVDFSLTTHHPLSHLEMEDARQGGALRNEC
jgi:hypothetical protein